MLRGSLGVRKFWKPLVCESTWRAVIRPSRESPSKYGREVYLVSGVSRTIAPRSHSFMTAYAKRGLLVDAASKTVSLSTGSLVAMSLTPKPRLHHNLAFLMM